jgi:hypothetical protein
MPPKPLTVFVSYTHDSRQHSARILGLANKLRSAGFDCDIDQYHANQDWPAWMERKIRDSDFILVVCTPTYLHRWNNDESPRVGLGAQWESLLTRQHLYLAPGQNHRFVPIYFEKEHVTSIPLPLTNVTRVMVNDEAGFDRLRCRLLNIPPAEKPPVRTSLAPFSLASGFFGSSEDANQVFPSRTRRSDIDRRPIGIVETSEPLTPNLFPVVYPDLIHTAKVTLKRRANFETRLTEVWGALGMKGKPPVDYWIEEGVIYRFEPMTGGVWKAMTERKYLKWTPPKQSKEWALSSRLAERNLFTKLLNRSLDQLCQAPEMIHEIAWSKQMRCHLFVAKPNSRVGTMRVKAISQEATREVYKAIRNKLSDDPTSIQHWQHQAFRHFFVRFGKEWYLNVIPFWAFTSDGRGGPSRWQKSSSANMRRPEKNRAVLGHVMFWASVLCREADMVRPQSLFALRRPPSLNSHPSIHDDIWIKMAKEGDAKALTSDLQTLL